MFLETLVSLGYLMGISQALKKDVMFKYVENTRSGKVTQISLIQLWKKL